MRPESSDQNVKILLLAVSEKTERLCLNSTTTIGAGQLPVGQQKKKLSSSMKYYITEYISVKAETAVNFRTTSDGKGLTSHQTNMRVSISNIWNT
jgi:hypothetical protein